MPITAEDLVSNGCLGPCMLRLLAVGYSPDLVVVSPADASAIQLLQMASGVAYAFAQSPRSEVIPTSSVSTRTAR